MPRNPDLWLATKLVELAEGADADADSGEATCVGQLMGSLAELLAPAEVGLVLVADRVGTVAIATASTGRARDLASFEEAHNEGPRTDCRATARPVLNERVAAAATRWPRFAPTADAAGFGIVSALPLRRRAQVIGSVGVFGPGQRQLSPANTERAQTLVKVAAIAIWQQREIRRSDLAARQLQRALDSRVVIEQAKGAIAARLGITPEAAFSLLRDFARRHSRALADVAGQAVRGELLAHELLAVAQGGGQYSNRKRLHAG
jgi:ANTAR domain-containing protein/GAF domain-containing protein